MLVTLAAKRQSAVVQNTSSTQGTAPGLPCEVAVAVLPWCGSEHRLQLAVNIMQTPLHVQQLQLLRAQPQ